MTVDLEQTLLGTTLMSSLPTHQRLKDLKEVFGCSEDILSRYAMATSMKAGPVDADWEPRPMTEGLSVINGKSIRGKTLFKAELALFLVMLAVTEPNAQPNEVRDLFRRHWERGVEMMAERLDGKDWLDFLAEQC
jgi:hypothetical protein